MIETMQLILILFTRYLSFLLIYEYEWLLSNQHLNIILLK